LQKEREETDGSVNQFDPTGLTTTSSYSI